MNVIITMAGRGQRFRDVGYVCPKYMIEAFEKSLFEWSMLSISDFFIYKFIFIVRIEDDAVEFIYEKCKKLGIKNFKLILLEYTTDGQATTALLAQEYLQDEDEIVIYNIDTYVVENSIKVYELKGDGFIHGFIAEGVKWSFIELNKNNQVVAIAEKKQISNIATLGLYYFKTFALYKYYYYVSFKDSKKLVNGEKYIAEMYDSMLQNGLKIYGSILDKNMVWGLGTPNDLQYFLDNYGNS